MTHSRSEVSDSTVSLFGPAEVRLGDEDMAHGQHPQSPQLLGSVEHHWREPAGHLGVEANLDPGLDLGAEGDTWTPVVAGRVQPCSHT